MSNPQRLNPLSDVVFSKLFEDMSSAQAMLEIINAVLTDAGDEPVIEIITMRSQYGMLGKTLGMHGARLDVKATTAKGDLFDIEVQLSEMPEMNGRAFFYASHMLMENYEQSVPYTKMPNVRVICIMDFELRNDHADFLQPIGVLYRKTPNAAATERYRAYNIELPKFRAVCKNVTDAKSNPLWQWLYLLSEGYKYETELEVLQNMTQGMQAFAEKYRLAMDDPDLRDLYDMELSAERNLLTREDVAERRGEEKGVKVGLVQGREEGREEGRLSERMDMARRMLNARLQLEQIAMVTGLSLEEIKGL